MKGNFKATRSDERKFLRDDFQGKGIFGDEVCWREILRRRDLIKGNFLRDVIWWKETLRRRFLMKENLREGGCEDFRLKEHSKNLFR